jgi:predicted RNase H-like nuclease
LRAARQQHPTKRVFADDDLIDACALALAAEAARVNKAWRLGDGARDARGLLMEICG